MTLEAIIGVGIICFVYICIINALDNTGANRIIRLLLVLCIVSFLLYIPALIEGDKQTCTQLLMNKTVTGNLTEYQYEWTCENPQTNIQTKVYNSYLLFLRIVWVTVFVAFIAYLLFNYLVPVVKKRGL